MAKYIASLFVFFAIYLPFAGLLGCVHVTYADRAPFYINNSGITVKLTKGENCENNSFRDCEREIENNDTLCNKYLDKTCSFGHKWEISGGFVSDCGFIDCGLGSGLGGSTTYFKIEFLSEPKVCLVFDGNEKKENDIRYWENYTKEEGCDTCMTIPYYYTITPDLMQQAKEEYCDE